ncbi:MAG TPA: HupE/UreJ family protein [Saprospiraceae bacterium]|nr:HupE/UreJ family protein [Saprospiraceae bacterium]
MFRTYLGLGFDHILDPNGYDHILFVVTLCAIYAASNWLRVLILVTAFTIGHSVTLALSTLDIVRISPDWVETLIPITIILTALYNFYKIEDDGSRLGWHYFLAAFFGLIHGLGFSNFLKALLGKEENILTPLLAFNLGVEIGQIVIVIVTVGFAYVLVKYLQFPRKYWVWIISGLSILISLHLLIKG